MRLPPSWFGLLVLPLCASVPQAAPLAPAPFERGAAGLGLALRTLSNAARVLYVTAHPDDEDNGVLVALARGRGLRTALFTLTRGEGGQNAIGAELSDALGLLRTEELLAGNRYAGVEQYFGRAYEFGYSFSVEETLERWGHEETLGDVVRAVRAFRPDVILTLELEREGGGQHHQALARLAKEAFRAAADPARFPEQVRAGLRPWQARKIYQGGTGGSGLTAQERRVTLATGVPDPLLGLTWHELGSLARSMHRSQGMRQLRADPLPARGVYALVDAEPPVGGAETDILDGIENSVTGWLRFASGHEAALTRLGADLAALAERLAAAPGEFEPNLPAQAIPALDEALEIARRTRARVERSEAPEAVKAELSDRLRHKEAELMAALVLAQGVVFEVTAADGQVVPGQTFGVTAKVFNLSGMRAAVEGLSLHVPAGWSAEREGAGRQVLAAGEPLEVRFAVTVAPDAEPSRPYWRRRPGADRHDLVASEHEGLPWSPPDVVGVLRFAAHGVTTVQRVPAVWRYAGPFVGGERRHVVKVVPAVSVRLTPEVVVVPLSRPRPQRELRVRVTNHSSGPAAVRVRVQAPPGWSVAPADAPLAFHYEDEEASARFLLEPPAPLAPGELTLEAVAAHAEREYREGVRVVAHDHVERRHFLGPARSRVLALDVRTAPGTTVGYVMGPGDAVADAIRQLGLPVTLLEADDLAFSDLSRFTTIVTGIRAYETRADLRSLHPRLIAYVEAGGHLVVQYNRAAFNRLVAPPPPGRATPAPDSPFVPYPAAVTSERISDETAPLRVLVPGHPLLEFPNRIGPGDFEGWVQERGIQFLDARDPRYVELLSGEDPFPNNPGEKRGMLVQARVGQGVWTYVGLGLFRQLPEGVPGAYRLLANLVSARTPPARPRASAPPLRPGSRPPAR